MHQLRPWAADPGGFSSAGLRPPPVFAESKDPEDRLVPVVAKPEHIMLAMSGDLLRTNACVFAHNGILGYPTIRRIELPCRVVPTPALNTQR